MAGMTALAFHEGDSFCHRCDARFKIIGLLAISLACVNADLSALAATGGLLLIIAARSGLPPRDLLRNLKAAWWLLAFVVIARALASPGTPLLQVGPVTASREGLAAGARIGGRLLLVLLAGAVMVVSTRVSELKAAVQWLLAPVPGLPEKRVGTMISLIVRFLPLVVDQARDTGDAQKARCIENRKNPVYRLVRFAIPVMRRIFLSADRVVMAMEARCYTEDRTDPVLTARRRDWLFLLAVSGLCAFLALA